MSFHGGVVSLCRVQSIRPENLCVSKSYPDLLALYPRYFAKIDRGEVFPEQPYPSQYDAKAGKSGASAGAYI